MNQYVAGGFCSPRTRTGRSILSPPPFLTFSSMHCFPSIPCALLSKPLLLPRHARHILSTTSFSHPAVFPDRPTTSTAHAAPQARMRCATLPGAFC